MDFAVDKAPGISEVREAMKDVALLAPLAMSEPTSWARLETSGTRLEAAASRARVTFERQEDMLV